MVSRRDDLKDFVSLLKTGVARLEVLLTPVEEGILWIEEVTFVVLDLLHDVFLVRIQAKQTVVVLVLRLCVSYEAVHLFLVQVSLEHVGVSPDEVDVWRMLRFALIEQFHGS